MTPNDIPAHFAQLHQDAILWKANYIYSQAKTPADKAAAIDTIAATIQCLPSHTAQTTYATEVEQTLKLKKNIINKAIDQQQKIKADNEKKKQSRLPVLEEDQDIQIDDPEKFPRWAKDYFQEWKEQGFITADTTIQGQKRTGFYFINTNNNNDGTKTYSTEQFSNFIAQPVMHVYAAAESQYIFKIKNHNRSQIIEVPAQNIPSPELFIKNCIGEGNFMMFGSALKWKRIASALLEQFKRCYPITFLGWQAEGFFAFVNGAYTPTTGWQPVDENGLLKHNQETYLIPASSQVYLKTVGRNTDPYEMDRVLTYNTNNIQNKPTLQQWINQMYQVYGIAGTLGVAAAFMALHRDVVFSIDNNCPLLYGFGEPSSGKSKWAESIAALYYHKRPAFNVNSGTDHGFFTYMQQFINTITHLNEVDEATLKPEWFQSLKGIYDGESRQRGRIVAGKLKTEIQKVLSLILLTGQKLITADDNSLVTRSLIQGFSKTQERTEAQTNNYNQLKQWEDQGLSHLIAPMLDKREFVTTEYRNIFNELLAHWRRNIKGIKEANQRIVQNWAHAAVCYAILADNIPVPLSIQEFITHCQQQAIKWSRFIATSDVLSEFWATIQNLVNTGQLKEGWDYIVREEKQITIEKEIKDFTEPTQILYLRLGNVHPLYEKDSRTRGKTAMSKENLLHYMASRPYFIGAIRSKKFYKYETGLKEGAHNTISHSSQKIETVASCHAFIYQPINIEITNNNPDEELPFPKK